MLTAEDYNLPLDFALGKAEGGGVIRAFGLVVLVLGLIGNSCPAAVIDTNSQAILKKLSAPLAAAKTAEVELRLAVKTGKPILPEGDLAATYMLSVQRPNKMALVLKEGFLGATVVSDGTNAITYIPKPNIYSMQPAPKKIGAIAGPGPTGDMGSMAFITALFSDNPETALLAGVTEAKHGGRVRVSDVECDRIDVQQEGLSWRLFATVGETSLVRRIEVTIPQLELTMDFQGWKLNPKIAPDRFKFTPPKDAKKVENTEEADREEGDDSELIGESIPPLKLKTIDGGTLDTTTFKDHVTLLVAWAGEAEHSVDALRAVSELAAANKIPLHTINVDEKPDKDRINSFLAKHKLPLKPAIDADREAIDKLQIEGVPLTFLINKSGVIEKAYLGFHPDFKSLVGKEITALLAPGK